MRDLNTFLADYGDSHRNPVNQWVHILCVPAIFLSTLGLFWLIPLGHWLGLEGSLAPVHLACLAHQEAAENGLQLDDHVQLEGIALEFRRSGFLLPMPRFCNGELLLDCSDQGRLDTVLALISLGRPQLLLQHLDSEALDVLQRRLRQGRTVEWAEYLCGPVVLHLAEGFSASGLSEG